MSDKTIHIPAGKLYFTPRRPRGRPRPTARDVAAYLAARWFLFDRDMPGSKAGIRSAYTAVSELWARQGYRGLSDRKECVGAVDRGQKTVVEIYGCSALVFEDGPSPGARVFGVPKDKVSFRHDRLEIDRCLAWEWLYGDEKARCGVVSTYRER